MIVHHVSVRVRLRAHLTGLFEFLRKLRITDAREQTVGHMGRGADAAMLHAGSANPAAGSEGGAVAAHYPAMGRAARIRSACVR